MSIDLQSQTWAILKAWALRRRTEARLELEQSLCDNRTADELRGAIKTLSDLLSHGQPTAPLSEPAAQSGNKAGY